MNNQLEKRKIFSTAEVIKIVYQELNNNDAKKVMEHLIKKHSFEDDFSLEEFEKYIKVFNITTDIQNEIYKIS